MAVFKNTFRVSVLSSRPCSRSSMPCSRSSKPRLRSCATNTAEKLLTNQLPNRTLFQNERGASSPTSAILSSPAIICGNSVIASSSSSRFAETFSFSIEVFPPSSSPTSSSPTLISTSPTTKASQPKSMESSALSSRSSFHSLAIGSSQSSGRPKTNVLSPAVTSGRPGNHFLFPAVTSGRQVATYSTNSLFPALVSPYQLRKAICGTSPPKNDFEDCDEGTIEDAVVVQASVNEHGNHTFADYRLPSSVLFDINACSNHYSRFSKMLPTSDHFEEYVNTLGISPSSHVIIYDPYPATFGFYAAPRVWWMFRVFGHKRVSVLNGGLRKWIQLSYPIESSSIANRRPENKMFKFSSYFRPELVTFHDEILDNIKTKKMQILDARTPEAYKGNSVHALGASSGFDHSLGSAILSLSSHIPGASSLYFRSILDAENGRIKSNERLQQLFQDAGINFRDSRSPPLMAYCHSGIASCSLALAAHICGKEDVKVYDASWEEWSVGREKAI